MRNTIKKAKKARITAKKHIKPISIILIIIISVSVGYFWGDIMTLLSKLLEELKENWFKIPLAFAAYKLFVITIVNLTKRFAINKGVERFKKTIIYSEMDELLLINISIRYKIFKSYKIVKFILDSFIVKLFSFLLSSLSVLWISIKTGLAGTMIANLFSAQFWTLVLTWIMNIPGFITILGLAIWLWLEAYLPWVPRFYNWIYSFIKRNLGKYWTLFEICGNYILDDIYKFEMKYFHPMGIYLDTKEVVFIKYLKRYVYNTKGRRNYRRYRKIVISHNNKQIVSKLEKERVARVFRFGILRRRVRMLKKYNKKIIKDQKIKKEK